MKWKDIVDLKSTMNHFNIIKIYTIFTQQQDTNSNPVPIDYKPGGTETYPGIQNKVQKFHSLVVLKSRDIILPTKIHSIKAMVFQ